MRISFGSFTIGRSVDRVYLFLTKLENLKKQIPVNLTGRYGVEFDDGIHGDFRGGTEITSYLLAKYEDMNSYVTNYEVIDVVKNERILIELTNIDAYKEIPGKPKSTDLYDWLGLITIEMILKPKGKDTLVKVVFESNPKFWLWGIVFYLSVLLGRLGNRKNSKQWVALVEKNA